MSQYSRASVLEWLNEVSSEDLPSTRTNRKRKREPLVDCLPNTKNIAPKRTPSPTKRRKLDQVDLSDADIDFTSRPIHSIGSAGHDGSQRISSSASSSVMSPRSRKMAAMVFAPEPILFEQFEKAADADKLPAELLNMLQSIEEYSYGRAVISDAHKIVDSVSKAGVANLKGAAFGTIHQIAFTHPSKLPGPSPTPQQCAKAVWLAQRCQNLGACETAWNSSVHNYVLDLAIHHDEFLDKVYFLNCTTARIEPTSLIFLGHAGTAIKAKMVDFVIHVEPSDRFREGVRARAPRHTTKMSVVNHTFLKALSWSPIGVSIETKQSGQGWNEAMMQVGIWVAAQFTKLEQLATEANQMSTKDEVIRKLPWLPLIIIQGDEWMFLAAIKTPDKQTHVYYKMTFGTTANFLGVYQVVTTLQLLARWVRDSYTPWFERTCLNLPEETATQVEDEDA